MGLRESEAIRRLDCEGVLPKGSTRGPNTMNHLPAQTTDLWAWP